MSTASGYVSDAIHVVLGPAAIAVHVIRDKSPKRLDVATPMRYPSDLRLAVYPYTILTPKTIAIQWKWEQREPNAGVADGG